ncbi:hypothetical protein FQR65_LT08619 [Abscondita terminalis]|nr:hypothetical protein FQR65_LT08619 [Abscondita terminalis]
MNKIYWILLFLICDTVAITQFKKYVKIQSCTKKVMKQIFIEGSSVINIFMEENLITIADEYPHVVVNMSNEIQGVYDKHGNNFILQARTIDMIEYSIITFLNHDLFQFRENTRGRFIVITQEKNISQVFLLMWDIFAINSVVLYYDDADKNKDLMIYTSNLFSFQNNCGKVVNKIDAESCDSDVIIRFPKVIKNFGGCPFWFGANNREHALNKINPFVYTLNSTLTEIKLMLNITILDTYVTAGIHNEIKYTERHYFGSFLFQWDTADDRTAIFFYDDMLWFGTKAEQRLNTFFTPFFMETWILMVAVFVSVVVIWWRGLVLEKFNNNQLQALFQSFSETSSLLFGVGISVLPKLVSLKILILFYLIYVIHIQTAYTSDMINTLVVPQYEHVVSNVYDLMESGIPTLIQNGLYEIFFCSDLDDFHVYNEIKRNLIHVDHYDEAKNYSDQKLFIVLLKQTYMFDFDRNPKKITNKFISNDLTGSLRISFFMLQGHYLLYSINRVISFLREFGFYEKAYEDGYRLRNTERRKIIYYHVDISEVDDWNNALRVNDFIGVFIVLSLGYTASIHIFVMNKFYWLLLFHICNAVALRKKFDEIQLCTEKVMKQIFIDGSSVINVFMEGNMITIADEYPHVVVNISNEIHGVYDKHGNNFILQARTFDMIEHLIMSFLNHDLFTFRENVRGRFIVITQEKNISEVFLLMWELFAINSVVLYYDDADKDLIIYTSKPFSYPNNCATEVNEIHAEFCDSDFIIRFPKVIGDFGGCPFIFGTNNRENALDEVNPFVYSLKSTLTEIQLMLNLTIQHVYVTADIHNRVKHTERHYFGSFLFQWNTADDRTDILFYDDLLWIGTKPEQRLNTIFTPFFMETWILIVVAFVFVLVIWWRGLLLEKFKNNQLQALSQSFSEISSLLFGVGISVLPKLTSLKILILFYFIYIIHIQTAYTSDMINTLVVPQYEHVVSNVHDLVKSGIPTLIQDHYHEIFFSSDLEDFHVYNEIKRNLIHVYTYDEVKNYSKQKLFIVLPKHAYMFIFNRNPKKITNKFISNDITGSLRVSFFMLRGSYLLSSINRVIWFLREFGFYEKAYEDGYRLRNTTNRKLFDYTFDISEVEDWNNPLRINDFIGVFIVLSSGCITSIVILLLEILINRF